MNSKYKLLIIFGALIFVGLFMSAKSAKAQTYIDWFPTPSGLSGSCNAAGTTASMSWNAMPPYGNYVRVFDDTTGAYAAQVPEWSADNGPSFSFTSTKGHTYSWWIHARDGWGNWGPVTYGTPYTCPNPPTCSSATPDGTAVYNNSTVRFYANGVVNATDVAFNTWSASGGQDDFVGRWGTNAGGGTWYVDVPLSSHPGDGQVLTHVSLFPGDVFCNDSWVTQYPPLAINTFTATPSSIAYNGSSTLSWTTTSASTCAIGKQSGPGPNPPGGTGGISGSWTPTGITGDTVYFISCNGVAGGNIGTTVTISVGPPPATCTSVVLGGPAYNPVTGAAYSNGGFVRVYAQGVANESSAFNGAAVWFPSRTNSGAFTWVAGTSSGGGTYYADLTNWGPGTISTDIYAYNASGTATYCGSTSYTSYSPLAINTFTATPSSVAYNGSSTLSWTTTSASTCALGLVSGGGPSAAGQGGTSGSWAASPLTSNVTYQISCNGVVGLSGDNTGTTVTITVGPPPPSCTSADLNGVTAAYTNQTVRVYARGVANVSSAFNGAAVWFPTSSNGGASFTWIPGTNAGGGVYYADLAGWGATTIRTDVWAYNSQGATAFCGTTYYSNYSPLAINTFSASPTSVAYNGSSTISWTTTSASTCALGLVSGGGPSAAGQGGTSGSWAASPLTSNATYQISCNGSAGGNVGTTVTISVGPPPPSCTSADLNGVTAAYTNQTVRVYARGVSNESSAFNGAAVWFPTSSNGGASFTWIPGTNAGGGVYYADLSGWGATTIRTDVHAYNSQGTTAFCGTTYFSNYSPLAINTFSASPTSVAYNGSSTLSWTTTSASTCALGLVSGLGPSAAGQGGPSGSWTASPLTSAPGNNIVTYQISCNGVAGGNTGTTVAITVAAPLQAVGILESNTNSSNNNGNCSTLSGWAWDPDFPNTSIQLHIYRNGGFHTNISAGDFRGDLPGNGNHGFTFNIPAAWKNGASHFINVYAIDLSGGGNPDLTYSPIANLVCAPPTVNLEVRRPSDTYSDGPIWINHNTNVFLRWSSTNATNCQLFRDNPNTYTGYEGTSLNDVNAPNLTSPITYRVDCTGPNGSASDYVTININAQPNCSGGAAAANPVNTWVIGTSGTNTVNVTGLSDTTRVYFATFTTTQGAANAIWYYNDTTAASTSYNIPLLAHPQVGTVNVDIYMSNANYTTIYCDSASFTRLSDGTIEVNSNEPASWTITCSLTNPNCPTYTGTNATTGSYPNSPNSTWTIIPAAKPGYDVEVLDGNGNVINPAQLVGPSP